MKVDKVAAVARFVGDLGEHIRKGAEAKVKGIYVDINQFNICAFTCMLSLHLYTIYTFKLKLRQNGGKYKG